MGAFFVLSPLFSLIFHRITIHRLPIEAIREAAIFQPSFLAQ